MLVKAIFLLCSLSVRLLISTDKVAVIQEVKAVAADEAKAIQPSSKLTDGNDEVLLVFSTIFPYTFIH